MSVAKNMESARTVANGTMRMDVLFHTPEEVAEAKEWMKGKQKVKNLRVLLFSGSIAARK